VYQHTLCGASCQERAVQGASLSQNFRFVGENVAATFLCAYISCVFVPATCPLVRVNVISVAITFHCDMRVQRDLPYEPTGITYQVGHSLTTVKIEFS